MKRIMTWVLLACMLLSLLAGCGATNTTPEATTAPVAPTEAAVVAPDENLESAIAYLKAFYKTVRSGDVTPSDYERLGSVFIATTKYEVDYSVDCDESVVKIVRGDNGMVTIDVNEDSEEEVPYVLTATITGTDGTKATLQWNHVVPVSMASRGTEIVDAAYALEEGESLGYEATLTGEVTAIDTPYSPDYKNITVSMKITGREDKPIMCYRMKGEGADKVMPGDIITVTGMLKNYKGTIEFDAGCVLEKAEKGANSVEIPTDPNEILKAAFKLDYGDYLPYTATLTGEIVSIGHKYSEKYGNVTVSMICGDGYYVKCYRMKGQDIDKIWLGDEITVTGSIMNYDGTIEFAAGSIMDSWVDKPNPKVPSDPEEIVKAAYKLKNFNSLPYYCTLTGEVTYVKPWNAADGYTNVDMIVCGKKITAYKLTGAGVEAIQKGDVITVWGMLMNYWGTIEFDSGCKLVSKESKTVDDLFNLEPGEIMEGDQVLKGIVTSVTISGSSCDAQIKVKGKTVYCPGLTGVGYDKLENGDTIMVRGTLMNDNGTFQFKKGGAIQSWSNKNRPRVNAHTSTSAEIAYAASQLGTADSLHNFILTGKVVSVDTPYDKKYDNVTVTMRVAGVDIVCYRMVGKGVDKIGVGDTIRVSGDIVNFKGTIEFTSYCKLLRYTINEKPEQPEQPPVGTEPEDGATLTIAEAIALGNTKNKGEYTTNKYYVTGVIDEVANSYYGNIYITDGTNRLMIYGSTGKGGVKFEKMDPMPKAGDTVTLYGVIGKYNAPQMLDGVIVNHEPSDAPDTDPADGSALTIAEALAVGATKSHNQYTSGKYYLTGTIIEIQNAQYGNMLISDGTGTILIYGMYKNGSRYDALDNPPQVGDTIKVYGKIGKYNTTVQMKNAELISQTPKDPDPTEPPAPTEPPVPDVTEPPVEPTEPPVPEETEPPVPEATEPVVSDATEPPVPEEADPNE